jgi:hypothetical protein
MRFVTTLILILAFATFGADDPFTGVWQLNPKKSKLPSAVPRNQIVRIQADMQNVRIFEQGIDAKGEPFKLTISAGFDGKHYGVLGQSFVDTVWFRHLDNHTIIGEARQSGKEIVAGTAVVSKNGNTLTVSFSFTGTKGNEIKAKAVFDKL